MRRFLKSAVIAFLAMMLLAGCVTGSISEVAQDISPEEKTYNDELTGTVSLLSSIESGEPRIWFETANIDGRNTKIAIAYIFDGGRVAIYAVTQKYMFKDTDSLGYLEDYYSLATDEAISLIKEKYEAAHRAYYEELVTVVEPQIANDAAYHNQTADDEPYRTSIEDVRSTYNALKETEFKDKPFEEYTISVYKDSSGNSAEKEEITTKCTFSDTYDGWYDSISASSRAYRVVKGENADTAFEIDDTVEPFEVYDTYYGGFSCGNGESSLFFITKCDAYTEFVLDAPETVGTVGK